MGLISGAITTLGSLIAALSQNATNGNSMLGSPKAPKLPDFLMNNPLPNGFPWGPITANNTNPYTGQPNTQQVRRYQWEISRGKLAPDGFEKDMLLINGAFPGPTIEANYGDIIEVVVKNNIQSPQEGTAIHWHGILQKESPWMDGVPAVSQCPIPPGQTMTYRFKADLYGSTWYHAHYSSQYAGGLFGPFVIYGPKNTPYDVDLGPVMLSDWYHEPYLAVVNEFMKPQPAPPDVPSDNNLINGKMNFDCSLVKDGSKCTNNVGISKFILQTNQKHRLRLINSGADGAQQFSIDGHEMLVMANDFVEVQPYKTNVVTLGVGQRTDVIVAANYTSKSSFWMRSNITCSSANQPQALAAIFYDQADQNAVPKSTAQQYTPSCNNDPLEKTVPFFPMAVSNPGFQQTVDITVAPNATGSWVWSMNNSTFRANYNNPTLLAAKAGNLSFVKEPQLNTYDVGNTASYRFVINNKTPAPHPMHLHGHNIFVLAEGDGAFNGNIVRPTNPQRRDSQMLRANGYMVFQAANDNPGVWPFHCHIAWHLSGGLYIQVLENSPKVKDLQIPGSFNQQCQDWNRFTSGTVVDQIDSGV